MTRYTVENTQAVFCFDEVSCYDSELHEAITHIPLLWGLSMGDKLQLHLQICYGPNHAALSHCALTVPPSHENSRTEFCQSLGSKATQKKAVIAIPEQRKSITEEYLAVGWGFLVQARYSCHPKPSDSYMLAKICLGKKTKSQYKNYSKWLGILQHRAALIQKFWECEIQSRRFYT